MREDLNKQLCERERRGSRYDFHSFRRSKKFTPANPQEDSGPAREGIRFRYRVAGDWKEFNENLTPLKGQIRKAVGRPYAKFYSELCAVFDKRSVINQHILTHLDDYLATNVYVRADGQLGVRGSNFGWESLLKHSYREYFVDPRDGIIKRNKARETARQQRKRYEREERAEREAKCRELPNGNVLRKIDDIWFEFTTAVAPEGHYEWRKPRDRDTFDCYGVQKAWHRLAWYERRKHGEKIFVGERALDCYTGEYVFNETFEPGRLYYSFEVVPKRYHVTKRSASRKTLKAAGLV